MSEDFSVDQIDHIELLVPERYEAAAWYERVLGLKIISDFEFWAKSDGGPLMISSDGGKTKVALFVGEAQNGHPLTGYQLLAFRVSAEGFRQFLERIPELGLQDRQARPLSQEAAVDHGQAYSIYFTDPWGNHLELTTYEYDEVARLLKARKDA